MLVLYGDADEFTGAGSYRPWILNLKSILDQEPRLVEDERVGAGSVDGAERASEGKGRLLVQCLDGGTHFWRGDASRKLLAAIDTFLEPTSTSPYGISDRCSSSQCIPVAQVDSVKEACKGACVPPNRYRP